MAFQTERIYIDGSLNVDGSIYQWNNLFVGGGGGGGGGDVGWSGGVGSNNQLITAAGDGSIVAESEITFSGGELIINSSIASTMRSEFNNISTGNTRRADIKISAGGTNGAIYFGVDPCITGFDTVTSYIDNRTGGPFAIMENGNETIVIDVSSLQLNVAGNLSEKIGAGPGLYYIGATAPGDDHGIASYSKTFGGNDYQYIYYRESNDYGGFFHRQGTSYSDLRQDYNYLSWQYGSTAGTDNELFKVSSAAGAVFNEAGLSAADFRVESNTHTHMLFVDSGNGFVGLNEVTPNCTLDASGTIRSTGQNTPAQGSGLELSYVGNPIGDGTSDIVSYRRTATAAYQSMTIRGSSVGIWGGTGTTGRENLYVDYGNVYINRDGNDINAFIETVNEGYMVYVDGGLDKVHLGNLSGGTTASRLSGARVTIGKDDDWTPIASSATGDNLFLYTGTQSGGAGDGSVGATIGFSGPAHGGGPTSANRRHAAIGGIQTNTTETDFVGLTFWTHNNSTSSTAMQESMRLTHDGSLHVVGDVIAFSTIPSDIRLKENIIELDNPLDKVLKLRGVNYNWKKGGNFASGLIAQEVEEIVPEVVTNTPLPLHMNNDGVIYKTVNYDGLVPYLIESIKIQQKTIGDQEKRINDLEMAVQKLLEDK